MENAAQSLGSIGNAVQSLLSPAQQILPKGNSKPPPSSNEKAGGNGDISKEELVSLCKKLNKKMQALESKYTESTKQITRLTDDRNYLLDTFSSLLNTNISLQSDNSVNKQDLAGSIEGWKSSQRELLYSRDKQLLGLNAELAGLRHNATSSNSQQEPIEEANTTLSASGVEVDAFVIVLSSRSLLTYCMLFRPWHRE